jgi:hypothetical protein
MSSLELLKEYETQIQKLVIINKELIEELNEERHKNKKLTKELNFFYNESRRHKCNWESMFYTPTGHGYSSNNYSANERGYIQELDNVATKLNTRSSSF